MKIDTSKFPAIITDDNGNEWFEMWHGDSKVSLHRMKPDHTYTIFHTDLGSTEWTEEVPCDSTQVAVLESVLDAFILADAKPAQRPA